MVLGLHRISYFCPLAYSYSLVQCSVERMHSVVYKAINVGTNVVLLLSVCVCVCLECVQPLRAKSKASYNAL